MDSTGGNHGSCTAQFLEARATNQMEEGEGGGKERVEKHIEK